MHVFDLHCDTLYEAVVKNKSLAKNDLHISLKKGEAFSSWSQCFAIWIPDDISSEEVTSLFDKAVGKFKKEIPDSCIYKNTFGSEFNAILTVENGKVLNGNLENIKKLSRCNVKMLTLTWNDKNELGDGADVLNGSGITKFGKAAIKELENQKIVIDVSHSSEKMFYDVCENSVRPFVASHSNSFKITPHRRNLSDDQFSVIKRRNGLVGINFYKEFLNKEAEKANMYDILRHTEHFLSLGGENTVCLGTDFDGAQMPCDIKGIESLTEIFELFLKHNYNEGLLNKIFYENAHNFFENFDF